MTPRDYIDAARVPLCLKPQSFGVWRIKRWDSADINRRKLSIVGQFQLQAILARIGYPYYTLLTRFSWATLHLSEESQEVVMEDSQEELRKHLPIWMNAKGKVLITGLGLGCVVRGLLASKDVDHITVIEIDKSILRVCGHEFAGNKRVKLIQADALKFEPNGHKFDYAWHDLWTEGEEHLQVQHMRLIVKWAGVVKQQGAWNMPRFLKRRLFPKTGLLK